MQQLECDVYCVDGRKLWPYFKKHHYLSEGFNGHRSFVASLAQDGQLVGFTSSIRLPHRDIKDGWRGHRTVILPDFQGLGLGVALNEWLAEWHLQQGHRFYSRTTHPRLGQQRERSSKWRATGTNKKLRTEGAQSSGVRAGDTKASVDENGNRKIVWTIDMKRVAYSHEYIGEQVETD